MDERYGKIMQAFRRECWAILPERLEAIKALLELRADGGYYTAEEVEARIGERSKPTRRVQGSVAILPLFGFIANRMNMMTEVSGGTSTEIFGAMFDEAIADKSIKAVVLDVDSPGGSVKGLPELSQRIYRARGSKPIFAIADSMAASAAYHIASAADQVWSIPSGDVGSIGVLAIHTDFSEADAKAGIKTTIISAGQYKTEGNPYEPLGDEARAFAQERVNEAYGMFVNDVARNRGISAATVRRDYGQGRLYGAKQAKAVGMIDRIGTLDDILGKLSVGRARSRTRAAIALAGLT